MTTRTIHFAPRIATALAQAVTLTPGLPLRTIGALRKLARQIVDTLAAWQQRAHDRAVLRELSAHELRDVGLTRADVLSEADKPFWRL